MNPNYERVAERANHRCEYCQAPELVFNFPFEVEHIIPVYRQGEISRPKFSYQKPLRQSPRYKRSHNHPSDPIQAFFKLFLRIPPKPC